MAAMRFGCLFSQNGNVEFLHKAQSPYSVNTRRHAGRSRRDQDTAYIEKYVTEVLAARELLYVGLETAGHPLLREQGEFCAVPGGRPRHCDSRRIAPAGRAGPRPQLRNRRLRARHRRHARADPRASWTNWRDMVMSRSMLVFDMDGVLVDVSESYRETIVQTVEHLHRQDHHARTDPGIQKSRRLEQRLELCRRRSAAISAWTFPTRPSWRTFNDLFLQQGPDSPRTLDSQRRLAGRLGAAIRTGDLHRTQHAGSRDHAEARGLRDRFLLVICQMMSNTRSRRRTDC